MVIFWELQVMVTGACNTEDEGGSSEMDEDKIVGSTDDDEFSDFTEEEFGAFSEEDEPSVFTEDDDTSALTEDDEFSDFTEEEVSSALSEEAPFSVDSSFSDEELLSLAFETFSSLLFVAVHTKRVESPQVIFTPALPEALTVSFTWQVPCSVSSSWMVSMESPLQIMSKPSADSLTVQPESTWAVSFGGVISAVFGESFFDTLVEESSPQATKKNRAQVPAKRANFFMWRSP